MGHLHDDVLLPPRPEFMSFFLFIFKFGSPSEVFIPAFLDTELPRGDRLEGNSWVPCDVPSLPNPTIHKGWPQHRGVWPLLFSNSDVGSFTFHNNKSVKVLWDRTYGCSSLSEKTRQSKNLLQRQHFLLSYLKTLSVGPARVWTCDLALGRPVLSQLR